MNFKTKGEKVFDVFNILIMILLSAMFILPMWVVLSTSFLGPLESARRGAYQMYVEKMDFSAYKILLSSGSAIYDAYKVTFFRLIVGTFVNLFLTVTLAYGMSKKNMPGRKGITLFVFLTMIFSGGLIPSYILVNSVGLVDSVWSLIIPGAVSAWNTILMRNFFAQIPESLEESAMIDGASIMTILIKIILPLSLPAIATIGMFYAVAHWNSWFDASIYINSKEKLPVQIILRNVVYSMASTDLNNEAVFDSAIPPPGETLKSAAIIVTTVPILFIYPFIQKYFVKGVMVGSVKG